MWWWMMGRSGVYLGLAEKGLSHFQWAEEVGLRLLTHKRSRNGRNRDSLIAIYSQFGNTREPVGGIVNALRIIYIEAKRRRFAT
jgi:hypothetical protein